MEFVANQGQNGVKFVVNQGQNTMEFVANQGQNGVKFVVNQGQDDDNRPREVINMSVVGRDARRSRDIVP